VGVTPDAPQAPVQVGEVVAGKYRIERLLGTGGMGIVMAARHLALDEAVALKFVLGQHASEREAIDRMLREARATFRLRSKHAVRVHDVGELPSGTIYIVMELLDGRDLRAELAARGPLPENEVVAYVLDACDALEEAHALGIVHRDLKPHNLFLAKSLQGPRIVKVLDFGMSKVDSELFETGPLTRPETALGTPRYMAPEQWKSATAVDVRADIWALGVVMFELLTGKPPLQDLSPQDRVARMLGGGIPSPRELRPQLTEAVTRVVMRCLRGNPSERWPSVSHLATSLRDAHPDVGPHAARAEVTATGVTVVVPPEKQAERAARAFGAAGEAARSEPTPPTRSEPTPPTRRETPVARGVP
jgi:serine/threonine-protein kinase